MEMYHTLSNERSLGAPASRLQGIMESLRFAEHVLGFKELHDITNSPLCNGVCKKFEGGGKRQASPFLVSELRELHRFLQCSQEDLWCRYFAGAVLLAVYSRSRWSDLQHGQRLVLDHDLVDGESALVFLEVHSFAHKTRKSTAFRNTFLPAIAPGRGVSDDFWATTWVQLREDLNMDLELNFPVMPAPTSTGLPSKRPLTTQEMKKWLHWLLKREDDGDGRRLTSHSCKATCLSFLSEHGASWDDRAVLGGHCMSHTSTITYSRDAMARPLMVLNSMLEDVRENVFLPDASRSGRFVKVSEFSVSQDGFTKAGDSPGSVAGDGGSLPDEAGVMDGDMQGAFSLCNESPDVPQGELNLVKAPESSCNDFLDDEFWNSDSSYATTSSSSDSEGGYDNPAKRLARPPVAPAGAKICQNPKTKMLHLMDINHKKVLFCGRTAGEGYSVPSCVKYDTPCCSLCWRKSRSG